MAIYEKTTCKWTYLFCMQYTKPGDGIWTLNQVPARWMYIERIKYVFLSLSLVMCVCVYARERAFNFLFFFLLCFRSFSATQMILEQHNYGAMYKGEYLYIFTNVSRYNV